MVPDTIPWNTTITYGRLEDARDGKVYRTVKIGDQTWMAENLAYRNTTGTNDSVGMCYNDSKDSCEKYGRLYLWTEALSLSSSLDERSWQGTYPHKGVCPSGWHVPTDSEWTKLVKFVGGTATAGTKLKSTAGWSKGLGRSDNGTDQYGFRLLPGGSLLAKLSYRVSGTEADLWSSTEGNQYQGELWYAYASSPYLEVYSDNKKNRNSVRCVED